jgi:hypothetical protein
MNYRMFGAAFAVAALTGVAVAADLTSGPQPGQNMPGAFHPLNVCNVDNPRVNGQKNCFV